MDGWQWYLAGPECPPLCVVAMAREDIIKWEKQEKKVRFETVMISFQICTWLSRRSSIPGGCEGLDITSG